MAACRACRLRMPLAVTGIHHPPFIIRLIHEDVQQALPYPLISPTYEADGCGSKDHHPAAHRAREHRCAGAKTPHESMAGSRLQDRPSDLFVQVNGVQVGARHDQIYGVFDGLSS